MIDDDFWDDHQRLLTMVWHDFDALPFFFQ